MGSLFSKSSIYPLAVFAVRLAKSHNHLQLYLYTCSQLYFQVDKRHEILWNQCTEHQREGYCGCSSYCGLLSLTVFVMFIFPHPSSLGSFSLFFFFFSCSLLSFLPFPPSFLFLLSQLEVLHYRLSISSKHHGSPAQSSYQALHAYQVLPSFHFVSFIRILFHHIICEVYWC